MANSKKSIKKDNTEKAVKSSKKVVKKAKSKKATEKSSAKQNHKSKAGVVKSATKKVVSNAEKIKVKKAPVKSKVKKLDLPKAKQTKVLKAKPNERVKANGNAKLSFKNNKKKLTKPLNIKPKVKVESRKANPKAVASKTITKNTKVGKEVTKSTVKAVAKSNVKAIAKPKNKPSSKGQIKPIAKTPKQKVVLVKPKQIASKKLPVVANTKVVAKTTKVLLPKETAAKKNVKKVSIPKAPLHNYIKYEIEFPIHASRQSIFNFLTDASSLSSWFADNVNLINEEYQFTWDGSTQLAKVIYWKESQTVRYHWLHEPEGTYFEFNIVEDELTADLALIVTDFAEDAASVEAAKRLWISQISDLHHAIGG
jgi:hypothetical protein